MKILQVASELAPIAKVGGLADVIAGLSTYLIEDAESVTLILPKYNHVPFENITCIGEFRSFYEGEFWQNRLWKGRYNGCDLLLIDPAHPRHFFDRGKIYGCEDDLFRFLYFSRAVYDLLKDENFRLAPDIIHLHDWQTAPLSFFDLTTPVFLTLHNLAHQGLCQPYDLHKIGLDLHVYNIIATAIEKVSQITTVSPTYAKEILTPEKGMGLDKVLQNHQHKCAGILNGIDAHYWDPEKDLYFEDHYTSNNLVGKQQLKRSLQRELGLSEESRPIVGCVTRLDPQKGVDLIKNGIHQILDKGGQFVLLGSAPIPQIHEEFESLRKQFHSSPYASINLGYNEPLAHRIYGGSDLFLIPSIFEPCGLTQMISLRYGTLPIARRTGGLVDTVFDGENGFVFDLPSAHSLDQTLDRAFATYYKEPRKWEEMKLKGMTTDYSWRNSAREYIDLYHRLLLSR